MHESRILTVFGILISLRDEQNWKAPKQYASFAELNIRQIVVKTTIPPHFLNDLCVLNRKEVPLSEPNPQSKIKISYPTQRSQDTPNYFLTESGLNYTASKEECDNMTVKRLTTVTMKGVTKNDNEECDNYDDNESEDMDKENDSNKEYKDKEEQNRCK